MFSCDSDQKSQRLINGISVRKDICYIRVQSDRIPKALSSGPEFPYAQAAQIILRTKFIRLVYVIILHKLFVQRPSVLAR